MSILLRDVAPRDFDAVLALNESAVPELGEIDMDRLRWFAANATYFRVAEHDGRDTFEVDAGASTINAGEPLAFLIGLRPGSDYDSPNYRWFCDRYDEFGYVDRIAVADTARRRGLASRLYDDFEKSLPSKVRIMTCEVNLVPPNETSMRFHERLGFRQVGSQQTEGGRKQVAMLERQL